LLGERKAYASVATGNNYVHNGSLVTMCMRLKGFTHLL
jgi:hypothetical protein